MSDGTSIEWTDATWNPITGCQIKSPGCKRCYAMKLAGTRMKHHWSRQGLTVDTKAGPVWNGAVRFNQPWLTQPLQWTKPRMIFVCAHSDLFYEEVPDEWIDQIFAVMAASPRHIFQVLTKRPERMRDYVFAQDGAEFLETATCPELSGIHPATLVRAAKEIRAELLDERTRDIKADMKRLAKGPSLIERALEVKTRDIPNVIPLPRREEMHSTAQIEAAIAAKAERINPSKPLDPAAAAAHRRLIDEMRAEEEAELTASTEAILEQRMAEVAAERVAHLPDNVVKLPETPLERYRRALSYQAQMKAGELTAPDAMWLGGYVTSAEFKAQSAIHEDFGDAYLS
ncbi:DUF5131 family protein [Mesorhizobium sp. B4-1-1]|nr:DUF5131 family protein [Mesorhizobium sp. B4-1-1]